MAEITKCLTDLTARKMPTVLKWETQHQIAFDHLKDALCNVQRMHAPVLGKEYYIRVDASNIACGALLGQLDENGNERPIAFASQKFTDVQRRWSVLEREAYAIIWALQKWRSLILFSRINLFSDHKPLSFLIQSASGTNSKLIRWALALQDYDLNLQHVRGAENVVADLASRLIG